MVCHRCTRESAGPAFLAIVGNKYGYRPFPAQINESEFKSLLATLENLGEDSGTIRDHFRLDENAIPPKYVLKPRQADQQDWWIIFCDIQEKLQKAATKCLSQEDSQKYFVSVTEKEIQHGILENPAKESQSFCISRDLGGITNPGHIHRHMIDTTKTGLIDRKAQELLENLKQVKVVNCLADDKIISVNYEHSDEKVAEKCIMECCDTVCNKMATGILDSYSQYLHFEEDQVFTEVMQHRNTILSKSSLFVGREEHLSKIMQYMGQNNSEGNQCNV